MKRSDKKDWISAVSEDLANSSAVYVASYKGLSVQDMEGLRAKIREAGGKLKVVKNRLMRLAISGTEFEGLSDKFTGTTLMANSGDGILMAKAFAAFAKDHDKFEILGGAMDGEAFDEAGVKQYATLPSLDELRAQLAGLIKAPAQKIASAVNSPVQNLMGAIEAYGQTAA